MSGHDPTARYWTAYEASLEPPAGSAARNLTALRRRLDAGERADSDPPRREPAARRVAAAGVLWWGKAVATSVGLGVGALLSIKLVVAGVGGLSSPEPADVPAAQPRPAASSERPPVVPAARPAPPSPPVAAPIVVPPPSEAVPSPPAAPHDDRRRSPAAPDSVPAVDHLRAEVALMDRAREALERNDAQALWRLTDEHARRFDGGPMSEERRAWRAVAACWLGHADGRALADRFTAAYPRSAQASKVSRACHAPAMKK